VDLLSPIKDHHSERRLFIARVVFASVIGFLLLGIVIARLIQLQVFDYEVFAAQSQGNRVRIQAVPPIRGLVFDREGRVLAENLPAYQLELIPEQVDDIDYTLARLAVLGLIEADDIPALKELSESGPGFKPVALNLRLSVASTFNRDWCAITRMARPWHTPSATSARCQRTISIAWTHLPMQAPRIPARRAWKTALSLTCTVTLATGT